MFGMENKGQQQAQQPQAQQSQVQPQAQPQAQPQQPSAPVNMTIQKPQQEKKSLFGFGAKKDKQGEKVLEQQKKNALNASSKQKQQTKQGKNVAQQQAKQQQKKTNSNPNKVGMLELYDDIISNIKAQKLTLPSDARLSNEQMSLEWGRMVTGTSEDGNIIKIFITEKMDNWLSLDLMNEFRENVLADVATVRLNYFINLVPHSIDWDSPKMKQTMKIWGNRVNNDDVDRSDTFTQRDTIGETRQLENKQLSMQYFNDIDLKWGRSIFKTTWCFQLTGERNRLDEFEKALENMRKYSAVYGLHLVEAQADIFDWARSQLPTCLNTSEKLSSKVPIQVMSDDTVSALLGSAQGKIGKDGVPIGLDVYSGLPVFHVFREDASAAENLLISAGTGGGKSVFVKNMLLWCLKEGMSVCVLDYEGDEYVNIVNYLNATDPGFAITVNMNAGSGRYFEPLRISDPTGAEEIDKDAKVSSVDFTKAMMKVLLGGDITLEEDALLSEMITTIYDNHGITDNPDTWVNSRELRISMIYDQLCLNIENQIWKDKSGDDTLHKVAKKMQLKLKKYFVEGESEYGTFGEVLNVEDIRDAQFIDFSFGNKGADQQGANETKIALKQLCVSKITNELSNYNKYVKGRNSSKPVFTLKIWEEVQRFVSIKGAEDIMKNCVTGGRKRGDIAFIVTNDLASVLDGESAFTKALKTNLTGYCVGYIPDADTREKFCEIFGLQLLKDDLDAIFKENAQNNVKDANGNTVQSVFKNAFLVKFNSTSKSPAVQTIVKAAVAPAVFSRRVFDVGEVDTSSLKDE